MDPLSAFEAELVAALRASSTPLPPAGESESGLGTARALAALVEQLSRLGGDQGLSPDEQQRTFALALRQVDVHGRPVSSQLNKPDVSYLGNADGAVRRVNIEIETQNLQRHVDAVNRDRAAHNVFLRADPWTGEILGGLERAPGAQTVRPLSAAEAKALLAQLPRPQRDPTLAVNARTKVQFRRPVAQRRTRVTQSTQGTRQKRPVRRDQSAAGRRSHIDTREAEWEALLDRAARELEG